MKLALTLVCAIPAMFLQAFQSPGTVHPTWKPFLELDGKSRTAIVKALAKTGSRDALRIVIAALIDPEREVVEAAREALSSRRSSSTFHDLVEAMPLGSQWEAAHLLSKCREPSYIWRMIHLLRHKKVEVRRPIALALGLTKNRVVFWPLAMRMIHDSSPEVRNEALVALQRFDDPEHKAALEKLLANRR